MGGDRGAGGRWQVHGIGLFDVSLEQVEAIFDAGRIKPAIVHVEPYPYLPEWELVDFCRKNGIVLQAFAALGIAASLSSWKILPSPLSPGQSTRPRRKSCSSGGSSVGDAPDNLKTPSRITESFGVSTPPEDAMREIDEGFTLPVRPNSVVETGVPVFIPREE